MFQSWFPESLSSVADQIDHLFWFATGWTGATGILVVGILAYFMIRYRSKIGRAAYYTHGNSRGALFLTLTLAALVFVALDINLAYHDHLVWEKMFGTPPDPDKALRVEIMPEQYAWNIRYAGPDNVFATPDDIVTINEFHTPVGVPVIVQLTSKDVIHSFFLPNLRIKQDAVPGLVTSLYFQPEHAGQFNIACAEHCGLGHYRMKGMFVVESESEFQVWLKSQAEDSSAAAPWGWEWNKGVRKT